MTALLISISWVLLRLGALQRRTAPQRNVRHECVLWWAHCCQDCPVNGEVWISLCIISCLGTFVQMAETTELLKEIHVMLNEQKTLLNQSKFWPNNDTYYTPGYDEKCFNHVMVCYILELEVVVFDASVKWPEYWYDLRSNYSLSAKRTSDCKVCELYEERSSEEFLNSFERFVQKVNGQ
ncbi:RING finger protein 150-like [Arapaima gigas]